MGLDDSKPKTDQVNNILIEQEAYEEIKKTNPCFHNFLYYSPSNIIPHMPYCLSIAQQQNSMSIIDIKNASYYILYQLEGVAHYCDLKRYSLKTVFDRNKNIMDSFLNYPYILEVTKTRSKTDKLIHVNIIMHLLPKNELEQYVKNIKNAVRTKQEAAKVFCSSLNFPK